MKVTVNVECSPEEARSFMGLPDVAPMQQALMSDLEDRLRSNMQALAPENLFSAWLPATMQGAEQVQKLFWTQFQDWLSGVTNGAAPQVTFNKKD